MIEVYNPSRLARQDFLRKLSIYLLQTKDPTLRQIKAEFSEEVSVEKQLEQYIKAGYVKRENRRYYFSKPFLSSIDHLQLDEEVWVETDSAVYSQLQQLSFLQELKNETNAVVLQEEIDFVRERLTLSSYFYKLKHQLPFSEEQVPLYRLLGDVNPSYALKYMTTFLLKFSRKEVVVQKRSDIFVQALECLGFIEKVTEVGYGLKMTFEKEKLLFIARLPQK